VSALPGDRPQGATKQTRDLESERILAGIGLLILAVACFTTLDTATKISVSAVPILMGVWFRYAFQAVATTAFCCRATARRSCAPRIPDTTCCAAPCC